MRILDGKNEIRMSGDEFASLAKRFQQVEIDVGTGNGRFVIDRATRHPDRLVIGLDPVSEAMGKAANRITRSRSRLDNALFIVASVEHMPIELHGACDQVFVNLPWGSLMHGLIRGDDEILTPLTNIGKPGTNYRIILNLRIFADPVPVEVRELPEVTVDYVRTVLFSRYQKSGLEISNVRSIPPDELDDLRTSWARRLSHHQPPPSIQIDARRT